MSREGACVKRESLEQTARYWVGKTNKEDTCGRELARGSVKPEDKARMDVREVLQESSRSSMYKV